MEIRGFITNLGAYAGGELIGKWVSFPMDADEFNEVMEEIGNPEEYFFTDWEGFDFGEYVRVKKINEYYEMINDAINEYGSELVYACIELWGFEDTFERIASNELDCYYLYDGVQDDYDLGYYIVHESGCCSKDLGVFANYLDYAGIGRDENINNGGGFTSYGYLYVG